MKNININQQDIISYTKFICEFLEISIPKILFKNKKTQHKFLSNTMMAILYPEENTIYINHTISTLDIFFVIAHELRHLYQYIYHPEWLINYQTIDQIKSIEEYNLQLVEIDANAFAKMIMINEFNITPLFESLSDKVKLRIHERMEIITTKYYKELY